MKIFGKSILLLVGFTVLTVVGFLMLHNNLSKYSILSFTIAGILLILGIVSMINNSNPDRAYESKVRDILTTFDSILVKSNSIPKLEGRNIIIVDTMDDLVDAQLEIRKPICYQKQTESCSFILLDDKEAYIYVEKLNDKITSPVEIELEQLKAKKKNVDEMDAEMLREIEKTTIVKLSNKKSYKVSPIRKKKPIQEEIEIL